MNGFFEWFLIRKFNLQAIKIKWNFIDKGILRLLLTETKYWTFQRLIWLFVYSSLTLANNMHDFSWSFTERLCLSLNIIREQILKKRKKKLVKELLRHQICTQKNIYNTKINNFVCLFFSFFSASSYSLFLLIREIR